MGKNKKALVRAEGKEEPGINVVRLCVTLDGAVLRQCLRAQEQHQLLRELSDKLRLRIGPLSRHSHLLKFLNLGHPMLWTKETVEYSLAFAL